MSICRVVYVYESIPIMYCFGFPCSLAQEFVFHRFPLSEDAAKIGGLAQQTSFGQGFLRLVDPQGHLIAVVKWSWLRLFWAFAGCAVLETGL